VPSKANPWIVIKALKCIEDGLQSCAPLEIKTLKLCLPANLVEFLVIHVAAGPKPGTLLVDKYDPFPLDRAKYAAVPVPEGCWDNLCHGFVILEALNAARTDPKAYAAKIKNQMSGCFNGMVLSPPWAYSDIRIDTKEGEAALTALCAALEKCEALPPLTCVPKACEIAVAAAKAIGTETAVMSIADRVKELATFTGASAETSLVNKKTRVAAGIVMQMLMCDGDDKRAGFAACFNKEVTTCGFALEETEKCGVVSCISLMQVFQPKLPKEYKIEIEPYVVPTYDFIEVCKAIPYEAAEKAYAACAKGEKVVIDYKFGKVDISYGTVEAPETKSYAY